MDAIEMLYQDQNLAVCVKPVEVLSQSGKSEEETMVSLLARQLGGEVYPVHRLDREAGGVMVYARTKSAAAELTQQIQQGRLGKEYLAMLSGVPDAAEGELRDLLFHDQNRNKTYVVRRQRKGVKEARLRYRVLAQNGGRTLVQVRLYTGRTHQIRVQFASRRMPLQGDGRYGGGGGQLLLWSMRLTLMIPGTGKRSFAKLPDWPEVQGIALPYPLPEVPGELSPN